MTSQQIQINLYPNETLVIYVSKIIHREVVCCVTLKQNVYHDIHILHVHFVHIEAHIKQI